VQGGRTYKTLNVCPLLKKLLLQDVFHLQKHEIYHLLTLFTFYHCIVYYLSTYAFLLPHVMSSNIFHTICTSERPSKHPSGGWWHFARYIFIPFISIISHIPLALKAYDTLHFHLLIVNNYHEYSWHIVDMVLNNNQLITRFVWCFHNQPRNF
jgi:hypothetical protein